MPFILIEIFSKVADRPFRRHHKHDPYVPAQRIHDLCFRHITLHPTTHNGALHMVAKVTGTFTAPTTRKSGAPLALTDIDHFSLQRNGVEIATLLPAGATIPWTDTSPLTGNDTYEVFTITTDGFISDASNDAVVAIVAADPASAVTDLTATLSGG